MKYHRWTTDEETVLRAEYAEHGPAVLARRLGLPYETVRVRAAKLGLRSRSYWSPTAEARIQRDYKCVGVEVLAAELGRTVAAVRQKAVLLGVADEYHPRPNWSTIEARFLELHAAGLTDNEIAEALGLNEGGRTWLNAHRRRLGLRSNRDHEHFRARLREKMQRQVERAGLKSFAEYRHRMLADLCRAYGLPEGLSPREVQIVLLLLAGPKTKSEIAAALGLTARPGWQSALNCGSGSKGRGWNYLARLTHRGLVTKIPTGRNSRQGPGEQWRYLLTAHALDLLSSAKEAVAS